MFSSRTGWDRSPNPLAQALEAARTNGRSLVDLTESNPTRAGLVDATAAIAALGHARGTLYEPSACGHPAAREAVAAYYQDRGFAVDPARVILSASTSESYAWLFKLLADPGETVLVPSPSYPLFSWLASLEAVRLSPYRLARDRRWRVDLGELERAIDATTRAIVLVHPNNPTGTFTCRDDAEAIVRLAARHDLALVVDEVFGDYAFGALAPDRLPSFVGTRDALTFVLSGLSKVMMLPQCKLGWTVVSGPDALVAEALARLELIADTYLSVSTPVQLALPEILADRARVVAAGRARVLENLAALDAALGALGEAAALRRLAADGGWYAILEVPRVLDEDGWVELLVRDEGVIVHPGYFFDLDRDGFLVVSLLPEPSTFADAIGRVVRRIALAAA